MTKRVYTFGQLDTILHRRGQWGHELDPYMGKPNTACKYARIYGNLFVMARRDEERFSLRLLSKREDRVYDLARVCRVAGGDTLYTVLPPLGRRNNIGKQRMSSAGRRKWMRLVRAFTPHEPTGVLSHGESYRVRKDGATERLSTDRYIPQSPLHPRSLLPTPAEWIANAAVLTYPAFCSRAKRFAYRLRRELPGFGVPAEAQMMWLAGGLDRTGFGPYLSMQVCTPVRENEPAKRLYVRIGMHTPESRRFFNISGDYATRHCQVGAWEAKDIFAPVPPLHKQLRWKSARSALAGIKEWLIPNLYIPGL